MGWFQMISVNPNPPKEDADPTPSFGGFGLTLRAPLPGHHLQPGLLPMGTAAFEQVYEAFQDFSHAYFGPLFGRREARDHSRHYLQALLVQPQERRNAENLSETVPASARAMQRFLTESPWDDDVVIGRLQEYLEPRLGHPDAV